jgi:hypothetical protein
MGNGPRSLVIVTTFVHFTWALWMAGYEFLSVTS